MSTRRLLRMMAGEVKSPAERMGERIERAAKRDWARMTHYARLIERIQRRESGDPDLPPMPFDFAEIEKRAREGK